LYKYKYKYKYYKRVWLNGITSTFQVEIISSILITRKNKKNLFKINKLITIYLFSQQTVKYLHHPFLLCPLPAIGREQSHLFLLCPPAKGREAVACAGWGEKEAEEGNSSLSLALARA
jgi:hypothetical protein